MREKILPAIYLARILIPRIFKELMSKKKSKKINKIDSKCPIQKLAWGSEQRVLKINGERGQEIAKKYPSFLAIAGTEIKITFRFT